MAMLSAEKSADARELLYRYLRILIMIAFEWGLGKAGVISVLDQAHNEGSGGENEPRGRFSLQILVGYKE